MTNEWIKLEMTLWEKPEVLMLSTELNLSIDEVVSKLLRLWTWFDINTKNGHASVTLVSHLETKLSVTGFFEAMKKVGWLIEKEGEIIIPNWDRHNSNSAKKRALARERQRRHRQNSVTLMSQNSNAGSVTKTSLEIEIEKEIEIKTKKEKNIKKRKKDFSDGEKNSGLTPEKNSAKNSPCDEKFKIFWDEYPKKTGKKYANQVFQKLNPDENLFQRIMHAVCETNRLRWNFTDKQFIPDPSTWLNGARWTDEIVPYAEPRKNLSPVDRIQAYNDQQDELERQENERDITPNVRREVH